MKRHILENNKLFFLIIIVISLGVSYVLIDKASTTGKVASNQSFEVEGILSIATLKDEYLIGENIQLTDPPDTSQQPSAVSEELAVMPSNVKSSFLSLPQGAQEILVSKLKKIKEDVQQRNALWTPGYNDVFVKSAEDKKKLLGLRPPSETETKKSKKILNARQQSLLTQAGLAKSAASAQQTLPDFFDWRKAHGQDYITPVKDQEPGCGSCWAFAAAAALEGSINIYHNNPDINADLSEQDLVSCFHGTGCSGASVEQIKEIFTNYYTSTGITTENCFPYTATDNYCKYKCSNWQDTAWKTSAYTEPDLNNINLLKKALIENGPLEVGMVVYFDFFSYTGGIYSHTTDDIAGYHAITIVGYGVYDGMDYWIVKNSWGEGWGEGGYFKILAGDSGIDSWFALAANNPASTSQQQKLCTDKDGDNYCSWGVGAKPMTGCPPCDNSAMDCDDSNPKIFKGCGVSTEPIGMLSITSTPPDANVYIKDLKTGKSVYRGTTKENAPLVIKLGTGLREVKLSKEDYLDYTNSVTITENSETKLAVTLRKLPKLIYPQNNDIYRLGDSIAIIGLIPEDFEKYTIEYGLGEEPKEWSNKGIKLENIKKKGNFTEGKIATWDTKKLSDKMENFYTLRLSFYDKGSKEAVYKYTKNIYLDPTLKQGWPKSRMYEAGEFESKQQLATASDNFIVSPRSMPGWKYGNSITTLTKEEFLALAKDEPIGEKFYYWAGFLEPVVADINKDGYKEVIIYSGGNPPKIIVLSHSGSLLWSRSVGSQEASGENLHMPLVGDIDNDGYGEIIAFNLMKNDDFSSELDAFNHDGSLLWAASVPKDFHPTMSMADLNLDGNNEIIVKGNDAYDNEMLTIISNMGKIISQWKLPDRSWSADIDSTPAVGNFDDDSELEVVIAMPSENAGFNQDKDDWINEGVVYIYNIDGSVVEGWPVITDGEVFSSPIVGDVNNDGSPEIILGLMFSGPKLDERYGGLYVFDKNGKVLPGWPFEKGYSFWSTPSLGDIDGDGDLEIAASRLGFETSLLHHDGKLVEGWPQYTAWQDYYSSIIVDVNNDGSLDVLTTSGSGFSPSIYSHGGVYAWSSNGELLKGFPKVTESDAQAPAVVDDIDKDGKLELVASSNDDYDFTEWKTKYRGTVYVWELDSQYSKNLLPWPMYMHDTQHTGNYANNPTEKPRPQSKIANTGSSAINGLLSIKIQKKGQNDVWKDYKDVIKDLYIGIYFGDTVKLDTLFNQQNVKIKEPGDYRVYAVMVKDGSIMKTESGFLESSWNFKVIKSKEL